MKIRDLFTLHCESKHVMPVGYHLDFGIHSTAKTIIKRYQEVLIINEVVLSINNYFVEGAQLPFRFESQ